MNMFVTKKKNRWFCYTLVLYLRGCKTQASVHENVVNTIIKKKDSVLYFSLDDFFDFDKVLAFFKTNTNLDVRYSIIPRVSHIVSTPKRSHEWISLKEQVGFSYGSAIERDNELKSFYTGVLKRLDYILDIYNIPLNHVTGIQLIINSVVYTDSIIRMPKFSKDSLGENKDLLNIAKTLEGFNKLLPLTSDVNKFGVSLSKNVDEGVVKSISSIDGEVINIAERINNSLPLSGDVKKLGVCLVNDVGNNVINPTLSSEINRAECNNNLLSLTEDNNNLSSLKEDTNNLLSLKEDTNNLLPLTEDISRFGVCLTKNVENGFVETISLLDDGGEINISERINKYNSVEKNIKLGHDLQFFQDKISNNIIIVKLSGSFHYISVYTIEGMLIQNIIDEVKSKEDFKRRIGNVVVYINKNGIYKKEIFTKFNAIQPYKISKPESAMFYKDRKIGTLDLETYNDAGNISKVYAIGFYAEQKSSLFYIGEDLNSDKLIINCLEAMLTAKYHKYTFYVHNFSKFDGVFILPAIVRANELNPNKFDYSLTMKEDCIISMSISTRIKSKKYTIKFVDSVNLLQSSLKDLCNTFETDVKKSYFPYDFVNRFNLFYEGVKPDLKFYYTDLSNMEKLKEEPTNLELSLEGKIAKLETNITKLYNKVEVLKFYMNIPESNWVLKNESLKYLELDLISLYQVIEKFQYYIFKEYHLQVTKSLTISSLAMDIYLRRYYNNYNIPLINKKSLYNNLRCSYFGGITEVYKPYGKNLFYYDVNSLYPYSALNTMPGLNCVFIDNINKNLSECSSELFGFYYCKIETSDKYIGLIPVRDDDGLTMPLGFIEGWYFSEELKFASKHGYKIEIVKGYKFDKAENVFKNYVEELYTKKSTTKDPVWRSIIKSLLNNLLGKFGMILDKSITELVSGEYLKEIQQIKRIKSLKYIGDKILVTHGDEVSPEVCDSHNVDYSYACLNDTSEKFGGKSFKESSYKHVSIAIASAITAYSRMYINQVKIDILNAGGSIYYTDTDSIVTDIKLDSSRVGIGLGQFKLEHEICEGYFVGCKTYGFINSLGETIIKAKGGYKEALSLNDLEKLYSGLNINTIRYETVRNYSLGYVRIRVPTPLVLTANMYNKRVKVYKNGKWVDTKPVYLGLKQTHNKTHNKNYITLPLTPPKKNKFIDYLVGFLLMIIVGLLLLIYIITMDSEDSSALDELSSLGNLFLKPNTGVDRAQKSTTLMETINNMFFNGLIKSFNTKKEFGFYLDRDQKFLKDNLSFPVEPVKGVEPVKEVEHESKILSDLGIKKVNLIELENEIIQLKEEISLLQIKNLEERIQKLDVTNNLDSIIKDLNNKNL